MEALKLGAKSFTHLFNAMSTFHHREPGMVGAAIRSIPNLYFVTDATAATGMPKGEYKLGSNTVHKCLGGVRLKDGTLAGSALTMDQALRIRCDYSNSIFLFNGRRVIEKFRIESRCA